MSEAAQAAMYYQRKLRRSRALVQALPKWSTGLVIVAGEFVQSEGNAYRATTSGTTGATAPSGYTVAFDGTVHWAYVNTRSIVTPPKPAP
jgi:hypothetical protein